MSEKHVFVSRKWSILIFLQGPIWRQVRGLGLSYGYGYVFPVVCLAGKLFTFHFLADFTVKPQAAQTQYESLIINTCGLILLDPQNGREHKGFV